MAWTDERLEERFDGIDRRFDEVDRRLENLDVDLRELRNDVRGLHAALTRGAYGVVIGLIGVIGAILASGG